MRHSGGSAGVYSGEAMVGMTNKHTVPRGGHRHMTESKKGRQRYGTSVASPSPYCSSPTREDLLIKAGAGVVEYSAPGDQQAFSVDSVGVWLGCVGGWASCPGPCAVPLD